MYPDLGIQKRHLELVLSLFLVYLVEYSFNSQPLRSSHLRSSLTVNSPQRKKALFPITPVQVWDLLMVTTMCESCPSLDQPQGDLLIHSWCGGNLTGATLIGNEEEVFIKEVLHSFMK